MTPGVDARADADASVRALRGGCEGLRGTAGSREELRGAAGNCGEPRINKAYQIIAIRYACVVIPPHILL